MFLFLDESKDNDIKILGGILIPLDEVSTLEKDFAQKRIDHKIFGELKWQNIDQYYKRYCDFLDVFATNSNSSYHGICYQDDSKQYDAAYTLIKTVIYKIKAFKDNPLWYKEPLYVLFDNNESLGLKGVNRIKTRVDIDPSFTKKLEFCNQGTSHVMGSLQISDIITGAVCTTVNKLECKKEKKYVVDYLNEVNTGIPLDFASPRLPGLLQYKIQLLNPIFKPRP